MKKEVISLTVAILSLVTILSVILLIEAGEIISLLA